MPDFKQPCAALETRLADKACSLSGFRQPCAKQQTSHGKVQGCPQGSFVPNVHCALIGSLHKHCRCTHCLQETRQVIWDTTAPRICAHVAVNATSQEREGKGGPTLDQGLSIHKAEAIDLVLLSPVMKGIQDEVTHYCMATVEHSIVAVVGGCIQPSQGRGLGLFVGALTGEAVLHLSRKQQKVPSVS